MANCSLYPPRSDCNFGNLDSWPFENKSDQLSPTGPRSPTDKVPNRNVNSLEKWISIFDSCSNTVVDSPRDYTFDTFGTTLEEKLRYYTTPVDVPLESWQVPDISPIKTSLLINSYWNENWYLRLDWAWRNLLNLYGHTTGDSDPFSHEIDQTFLLELGHFCKAATVGALEATKAIFKYGLLHVPQGFTRLDAQQHGNVYILFKPKYKQDLVLYRDGLVYTFVLMPNANEARKVYGNDIKGRIKLCNALTETKCTKIALPLACMLDVLGLTVFVEPMVLVDEGGGDINTAQKSKETWPLENLLPLQEHIYQHLVQLDLVDTFLALSKAMHLASWPLPFGAAEVEIDQGQTLAPCLYKVKDAFHLKHFHEVMPRLTGVDFNLHRYRPEYKWWTSFDHCKRCTESSACVRDVTVDQDDPDFYSLSSQINGHLVDSWDVSHALHAKGINLCHIGHLFHDTRHVGLKTVLQAEMVARACKRMWRCELVNMLLDGNVDEAISKRFHQVASVATNIDVEHWLQIQAEVSRAYNVQSSRLHYPRDNQLLLEALAYHFGGLENGTGGCSLAYPSEQINTCKLLLQEEMCNKILRANVLESGLGAHLKAKVWGMGFPCDPICVASASWAGACSKFKSDYLALNHAAMHYTSLQFDRMAMYKTLLALGYEYLKHGHVFEARIMASHLLECANVPASIEVATKFLQAQLIDDHNSLSTELTDPALSCSNYTLDTWRLDVHVIGALVNVKLGRLGVALQWIHRSKELLVNFALVQDYTWLPISMYALAFHCLNRLNRHLDASRMQHQVVALVNSSNVPKYTACTQTWLLVEALLNCCVLDEACTLAMAHLTPMRSIFGSCSLQVQRALFVAAWTNYRIASIHLQHHNVLLASEEIRGGGVVKFLEALTRAHEDRDKKRHHEQAIALYMDLYKCLDLLCKHNVSNIKATLKIICPDLDSSILPSACCSVTLDTLVGTYGQRPEFQDDILALYLGKSVDYTSRMYHVIDNFLQARVHSATNAEVEALGKRCYMLYMCQEFSDPVWNLTISNEANVNYLRKFAAAGGGVNRVHASQGFKSSIKVRDRILVSSNHLIKSVERLLMDKATASRFQIAEACIGWCSKWGKEPNDWYQWLMLDASFESKTCLSHFVNVLRWYLGDAKRLMLLFHVARLCKSPLEACTATISALGL